MIPFPCISFILKKKLKPHFIVLHSRDILKHLNFHYAFLENGSFFVHTYKNVTCTWKTCGIVM